MKKRPDDRNRVLATNKGATREYEILETLECGLVLTGSEVKSLRESKVRLDEAFARVVRNEFWLIGMHIAPYSHGVGVFGHTLDRQRKLLVHRSEMQRWNSIAEQQRLTMVPLRLYLKDGRVKVEIGLGKGLKHYDKRQVLAKRDADREAQRAMADARRR